MLWSTWLIANICMWMNDVASAWLMTTLTAKPIWVALVQTASTLPVFLLGLPSGALADLLDPRRYFLATQFWVAIVATALCALAPNVETLVAFRLVQGLAGAAGIVIARAVVRDLYDGVAMARFFSTLMLISGVAPVVAPLIVLLLVFGFFPKPLMEPSNHTANTVLAVAGIEDPTPQAKEGGR